MQQRNLILLGIAVLIGIVAVYLANTYFTGVEQRQERIAEEQKLERIVVASQDLAFGTALSQQNLRLVNWPAKSVPVGAFTSIEAATKNNRVSLRPIVTGEPVLASKVSGADGRATLAANLPSGMLAYSVSINDVAGVGGFVRPGDTVDVLLTRPIPGDGASGSDKMTDVVLQSVPVLGIDQVSDENEVKPAVGKVATLQVDTIGAQKLALASQLGTISLALRNVTDQYTGKHMTVIPRQLTTSNYFVRAKSSAPDPGYRMAAAATPFRAVTPNTGTFPLPRYNGLTMTVVRGSQSSQYEVQRGH